MNSLTTDLYSCSSSHSPVSPASFVSSSFSSPFQLLRLYFWVIIGPSVSIRSLGSKDGDCAFDQLDYANLNSSCDCFGDSSNKKVAMKCSR